MKTKIIFLLVISYIVICVGQESKPILTTDSDTENPTKSLENGVKGLVKIVHSFLKTVQSEDFVGKTEGPISFTDVEAIIKSGDYGELSGRWRDLVAVFGGFAACVVIGLLFVLCMPLAGFGGSIWRTCTACVVIGLLFVLCMPLLVAVFGGFAACVVIGLLFLVAVFGGLTACVVIFNLLFLFSVGGSVWRLVAVFGGLTACVVIFNLLFLFSVGGSVWRLVAVFGGLTACVVIFNLLFLFSVGGSVWRLVAVFGGFAACVVIGLLFVLCMPLAGCITCCCYCCCKKCGKASSKEDPKNAKCKRVTFGSFLFIFTVLILVGAIFSVISNEILHSKLENVNDQGPIGQVKSSLDGLVDFAGETANEIVQSSEKTVIDTVKELLKIIKGASEQTVQDIQNSINATELLNQVESLGENANISAESLTVVTKEVTSLKDLGTNTTTKLTDVKNNITAICNGNPQCPINTDGLNLATDFSQLDDLGSIGAIVQAVTDISKKAGEAREQFNGVKDTIQTELSGTITDAEKKTNQTRDDILKEIPSIRDTLKNITKNLNLTDGLNDANESIKQYGDYVWYAFIGVPCLTLLVVVFYLFGLLFGICGERPGRDARCCNKGAGSNMLCCGVVCSYLIGSVIMFVVILMFIPFGLLYTNGCRYLNDGVENIQRFEFVISESMGYNISEFIDPKGKSGGNITVGSILGNCKKNMGVYSAFHLENLFSLDEILNMTKITSEIDKIVAEGSKASLGNITIIPDDLKKQLTDFAGAGINNINFTQYEDLNKDSVPNLNSIMDELNSTAHQLQESGDTVTSKQLLNEWEKLLRIQQHEIPLINQAKGNLTGALDNLKNQTNLNDQVQNVIDSLTTSQNTFNQESTRILKESLVATSQTLVNTVSDQLNKVKTDIRSYGKCEPVYKNVQQLSDAFCVTFLDPVNSIWFGLGWGLAFFIPAIIFALLTVNLYQREEPYDTGFHRTRKMLKARDKEESTFDNPDIDRYQGQGYDAYGGPGADNIPLTGVGQNRDRNHSGGGGGVPNQGYYSPEHRGGHPDHRNSRYPDHRQSSGGYSDHRNSGGYPSAPPPYNGHGYDDGPAKKYRPQY
ncbi:prominin-1-like [Mytilus trossulus]|uniref:prominin-1-like n=1 Tax=Mytilus trossulus TaxID=6551 RepID=UPI00300515B6